MIRLKFPLTLIFLFIINLISAQKNTIIDSLENLLKDRLSEERRADILSDLSYEYVDINPRVAQNHAVKALQIATKIGDKRLIAKSCQYSGTAFYNRNILDTAKIYFEKSILLYTQLGNKSQLGSVFNQMGNLEADHGKYEKSMEYYLKALKIFEETKNIQKIAIALSNLGALYINLGNYEKMYEYTSKALEKHRTLGNKMGIATCQANLADYYFQKLDTIKVIKALSEAQQLFHQLNAKVNEANTLGSIGDYYSVFLADYNKAINYYNKALNLLSEGDHKNIMMDTYRKISLAHYKKNDYKNSLAFALKADAVTDTSNLPFMQYNYYLLTYCYMGLRDFTNGENAFDKYVSLTNQVNQDNQSKRIAEMEVKYQTEKKQQQIEMLEKEKKINRLYQWGLIILLFFILIITFFIIRSAKQKQILSKQEAELHKQKVKELEKEHQLLATKLVLEGEETERGRLARDLHDGLGGLLSGVKLSLTNMKGNVILSAASMNQFDNVLGLLDTSINELRRVAHNMMPEALVKFGLRDALEDFCERISSGKTVNINFNFFGSSGRFDQALETSLYRIAQELVNNALKHAKASEILVQLVQENKRIYLTVQDNGRGFNLDKIDSLNSSGLRNIKARVESVNGRLDIQSKPGEGTEIGVEFEIG